ncbi:uncharacterized protein J3D65DRAFT_59025 [Phyllosticta citribraziliensis]|uniref:Involucrin repeat protein n=1 Tax=Phyllosticta citribraziliensis TaxID=989973 RepID=A0ABR1LCC1_9PEZI
MWNKLTGKSDTSSQDGRRKDQRRRTGSVASSHASRNPTRLEDRSDYPPTLSSRGTTYPPPPSSASIASYATAPDRRSTMDHDVRSERTAAYDDREDDPRSTRTDRRRDDESRSERSSKHRERSTSRDRKRDRDDTEREHKKKGKKDTKDGKERREKDEPSKKSTHKSRARASSKADDSIVDEPVRPRAGDSLQRGDSYTSQTAYQPFKYATESAPTTPAERLDAHVGGQFPGQNPSKYAGAYRPPLGEATSYYGDQGESVTYQPGVRVEDPDMLINPHTHLITPSAVPQPPEETGHGSAADFYSGTFDVGVGEDPPTKPPRPQSMPGSFEPDARPKPTRKSSKTEKVHKLSSAASAAGSAALGYALGKHSSHNQSGSTHVSSRIEENVENYTSSSGKNSGHYSTSYSVPPSGDYVPPTSQSDRPGENYISGDNLGHRPTSYSMPPSGEYVPVTSQASRPGLTQSYSMPASGAYVPVASAAGLAAGYGLHELHSSHHHSPALPPRPSQNGNHGSQGLGYAALGMQHRQNGPVSKFVDWWKDHEDVRKMEEYTEYIGVCRDCFDPREPPSMAPRKHHYHHHHKRRSNGSLRSNRVDKESRYHYSSSDDDGRRNSNSWVAKGLAGYGLAKVGKALWWQNQDFDDTYSAKSGRRYRSSRSSTGRRSRSGSRDRTSTTSRGVIRHRSNSRDSRTSRNYSKTIRDYKIVHHHGHSRSRSRSRDRKSGVFSAAAGAALGASLVGRSKERSRSRSKSPSREYVIKKSYVEKPRSSGSALGVEDARRFSSRHSTTSSHVDHNSHRSSKQNSTGVFGLFTSAASASDRRKTHSKKKKGFFTFANGSSSSTDSGLVYGGSPELRRRSSELRRKGSHKKRRNSDDKLNSTLLGLGATAAALAAVQGRRDEKTRSKHRPSPEVIAVRESKSRKHPDKRQHMPGSYDISSSEDEEWEEVSDAEDDAASIDTGLAFGDYAQSIKSRKSVDSLRSDGSGTNKWDWRWGSKKDKRKRTSTESLKNGTHVDGRSSVSSVPTLQTVFPVPTSDPTMFDAAGRSSSIPSTPQAPYGHPLVTSRPEPPPLQQPQPIMPVSNSIYTSQAPGPSYMAPSGPPVFSSGRPPLANFRNSSDYFRAEDRPMSSPRREEPSTPTSSWKRDAAIAGVAAATGAAIATAHSHASSKAGSSSPSQSTASRRVSSPSSVRFDLTKEQEAREDRQRRKDLRKKEEEQAERERLRRLEDEASLKEAKKREEAENLAAIKRDAEEMQARAREKREREGRAYAASEMERETRRIQRERETMALQAAELERAARDEAERLRQESEAATRQRERLEREILEADSRRERERAEAEERQPSEFEYDVESRERQLQEREADVVDPNKWSGWKEPAAAVGIAAGAAAAAAGLAYSSKNDLHEAPRDDSPRGGRVQFDDDRNHEEPSFDPDYFRKRDQARPSSRDRESDIVRKAASKVLADYDDDSAKVLADLEERYKEPQRRQSMAEFFSPSELSDRKTSISRDYFGPNADADVQSFNVPRIVTVEPPYAPEYSFTATHDDEDAHRYNDIPRLNLIEPTPPVSVASSIRGDRSHPTSPSMPAHHDPITTVEEEVEPKDDKQPKRPGVTWGVDETHYFDTPTPDSVREHFVSDQDLRKSALEELTRRKEHEQEDRQRERQEHDEIVVEHDSPNSPGKRTSYRVSPERSYAEAELPPKPELDRKPKSRSSDDDSPVEEIKRFEDDDREIIEATSPERTPVVLTPTEQRGQFYQSPFFETVSDFTTAFDVSPTGSASGFVEELGPDERPDVSERGMPGAWGFVEDDVASNPFSDTRVVEELPSPTEPHAKDPDLQPKVEEVEDQVFEKPLSKREQRKKDKVAKRGSLGHDDSPSVASTPMDEPVPEELWEDTSSSKSKKKKKKNRDSFGIDTGSASASVASTPVAEEPAAEDLWAEVPLSKKDKRKKKERDREEKRMGRERDPKDMEPSITTTSGSYTPSASGLDIAGDAAKGLGYAAAAGVLAGAMMGSKHTERQPEEPRGREQTSRQPPYPTEDPYIGFSQTPGSYGSEGEHTPSGTFTSTAPYIPSRAFDDVEELADAKKPGKKGKRRSKYGSPSPGSPLRTEVAFDDYVGMDAAAAATAALPHGSNAGAYQTSDFADAVNAPLPKDDASVSSRESEKESRRRRQYVYDEPEEAGVPLFAYREQEADNERNSVFAYRDDWKEHRRGSRQESEGGVSREGGDARSTASDERVVDEHGRRKHRHHRRRESERSDSTRDADTRSVVSEGRYDEEGHRKHKHRKHRSTGVDKDDVGAVVAEFRDDEDDDLRRKHKHKKRFEIEPTIPERPKSDPGVEDAGEERRKHKRRSKRESERGDDEDNVSIVSGPAKYSEKEKEKRSSLFSSLFGRSSKESVASRESKDDRSIDDEERKHRRRKHRSSTLQSSYASDPEDDGVSSTTASRRHRSSSSRREKESARDDSDLHVHTTNRHHRSGSLGRLE